MSPFKYEELKAALNLFDDWARNQPLGASQLLRDVLPALDLKAVVHSEEMMLWRTTGNQAPFHSRITEAFEVQTGGDDPVTDTGIAVKDGIIAVLGSPASDVSLFTILFDALVVAGIAREQCNDVSMLIIRSLLITKPSAYEQTVSRVARYIEDHFTTSHEAA